MSRSTDWEARYAAGDMPWDKGMAAPPLGEIDVAVFTGRVLVPGCGFGHDVRKISSATNRVIGLDLSESAVQGARIIPRTGGEEYVVGNLFALPESYAGQFDAVFEHTCFCAIDPADRPKYVSSVARILKPGGVLAAIFYINPGHEEGPPFPVGHAELDELFDPEFDLLTSWAPKVSFPGREEREQVRIYRLRGKKG